METKESILTKGCIYSIEELGLFNCKYLKETTAVIFFKNEETIYVFDLGYYLNHGKYKLLSILD